MFWVLFFFCFCVLTFYLTFSFFICISLTGPNSGAKMADLWAFIWPSAAMTNHCHHIGIVVALMGVTALLSKPLNAIVAIDLGI